jgi:hypothetical protein
MRFALSSFALSCVLASAVHAQEGAREGPTDPAAGADGAAQMPEPAAAAPMPMDAPSPAPKAGHALKALGSGAAVGVTAAVANATSYVGFMSAALLLSGFLGPFALLIPVIGVPVVVSVATYVAAIATGSPAAGALVTTGATLVAHYLGLVGGAIAGAVPGILLTSFLAEQGTGESGIALLFLGGIGAAVGGLVGAGVGGTAGSFLGASITGSIVHGVAAEE